MCISPSNVIKLNTNTHKHTLTSSLFLTQTPSASASSSSQVIFAASSNHISRGDALAHTHGFRGVSSARGARAGVERQGREHCGLHANAHRHNPQPTAPRATRAIARERQTRARGGTAEVLTLFFLHPSPSTQERTRGRIRPMSGGDRRPRPASRGALRPRVRVSTRPRFARPGRGPHDARAGSRLPTSRCQGRRRRADPGGDVARQHHRDAQRPHGGAAEESWRSPPHHVLSSSRADANAVREIHGAIINGAQTRAAGALQRGGMCCALCCDASPAVRVHPP